MQDNCAIIQGSDDSGVLYGCVDFLNRYLTSLEYPNNDYYHVNCFDVPWPDFDKAELEKAVEAYQKRNRRFGGLSEE